MIRWIVPPSLIILFLAILVSTPPVLSCTGILLRNADGTVVHGRTVEFGYFIDTDVVVVPRQYEFTGTTPEEQGMQCIDYLEEKLFRKTVPPDEVAAIFVEAIQGEGGYIVPPEGFLKRLKSLTEKHGILFVVDEVQSGMGRTGKMFAIEHWDVVPDIVCLAKGLASGMPLGAIVASADIMNWPPGSHGTTFGGNPLSCVAALETIRLLEGGLAANATRTGDYLRTRLADLADQFPLIGDVRGLGLMIGVELVRDRLSKEPATDERNRLIQHCFQKGLLLLGCGENTVRFCPPLIVAEKEADTAVSIFADALTEIM